MTKRWERKRNNKIINPYATLVCTVANLWLYCNMLQKIWDTAHLINWVKWCLVCQIFSIWHIWHIRYGCSYKHFLYLKLYYYSMQIQDIGVWVRVRLPNRISPNPYNMILPKSCKKMRALYNGHIYKPSSKH